MAEFRVARLDDIDQVAYRGSRLGRVRDELGIRAFGISSWTAHEAGDETIDAPQGTLVFVPQGPNARTAFAEEAGTIVLAIGATVGKAYEADGWLELWGPVHDLHVAGDYEGVIAKGREAIEANPQYGGPLYNLACVEALAGHPQEAIEHLRMAIDVYPAFRDMARDDSDFDTIREEPAFRELLS